ATEWMSTSVSTARSDSGGTHSGSAASSAATSSRYPEGQRACPARMSVRPPSASISSTVRRSAGSRSAANRTSGTGSAACSTAMYAATSSARRRSSNARRIGSNSSLMVVLAGRPAPRGRGEAVEEVAQGGERPFGPEGDPRAGPDRAGGLVQQQPAGAGEAAQLTGGPAAGQLGVAARHGRVDLQDVGDRGPDARPGQVVQVPPAAAQRGGQDAARLPRAFQRHRGGLVLLQQRGRRAVRPL